MRTLLGVHVSIRGGVEHAPGRGRAVGATVIQVFTKTPSQWHDPVIRRSTATRFRNALSDHRIACTVAHDSYLINLASPDPHLSARSTSAFIAELRRCETLGIEFVVSHPGNYIDDRKAGLRRNAKAYTRSLRRVPGSVKVLLESTAGSGTALGSTFDELATLRALIGDDVRHRVGFCADTCHLYSAGYDLRTRYEEVWDEWDRVIGLSHLHCLHLNDSATPFGSRRDRHALIGDGSLGREPFRRIMRDPRFHHVPKILETPKGEDETTNDRRMIRRLLAYAAHRQRRAGA
jgi:deoxyribonuclease-4